MKILHTRKGIKAFTLMEVVIVFILLGILAVAVIPTFTEMDDVGYQTVQEGTLGALRTAWTVAYADSGNEAPTLDEVAALVTGVDTSATVCDCTDTDTQITCAEVYQADATTTKAEFGVSGYACESTVATPNLIVIIDG